MPLLRLFRRFILRALMREKARGAVAVCGIAAGVAVVVAIQLANSSVVDTFRAAVDAVSGDASLRIRGRAGRFDEQLLEQLRWIRDDGQLSPVIETYAMVATTPAGRAPASGFPRGELLHVLGVDVLLDFPFRDYRVLQVQGDAERGAREILSLLDDPYGVILTEKFLRRQGLRVGDTIPLVFGSRSREFTIRGVLLNRGPARTLDGHFALMDIATAQWAADRLGTLDYVDVLLDDTADSSRLLRRIQERLPVELVAELPDAASSRADTMIAAFQFNLTALSTVALLVGLFLIYNTVAMSVAARRPEIGMLRAVGATRRTVLALFLGKALMLAMAGVALGLPAGRLLAAQAVSATAQTVETFYIQGVAESSAAGLRLDPTDALVAGGLAIPLAMLAALIPAWEAASLQPVDAAGGLGVRVSTARLRRLIVTACFTIATAVALTQANTVGGRPLFGFLAELLFMLGGAMFTPAVLWLICESARRAPSRLMPAGRVELRIAAANLLGALSRVSVSVAALAVSLSMMVAIAVMVGSFRETVTYWLDSVLSADLAVRPVMQTSAVSEARLSKHAVDVIESDPAVEETVWYAGRQLVTDRRTIRLAVTELDKTMRQGRVLIKDTAPRAAAAPPDSTPQVLVSESFSLLFHADAGQHIELPTPRGAARFHVAAVYYDYASNQGTVMMDVDTYRDSFSDAGEDPAPQVLSIYLQPGADPEMVRTRLVNRLDANEQVYCVTHREVRREALRIFESTFAVTYALEVIAIIIAGLGVASTLVALIYQRQREIGLLSLIGATYRQVRRVVLLEAVLIGAVSQLLGVAIGMVLAYVLIHVINVQSFGWTIQFHLPIVFLSQSTILVIAASAVFALYPAVKAASADALLTVRQE